MLSRIYRPMEKGVIGVVSGAVACRKCLQIHHEHTLLRVAVVRGLRPEIRLHVLQSGAAMISTTRAWYEVLDAGLQGSVHPSNSTAGQRDYDEFHLIHRTNIVYTRVSTTITASPREFNCSTTRNTNDVYVSTMCGVFCFLA